VGSSFASGEPKQRFVLRAALVLTLTLAATVSSSASAGEAKRTMVIRLVSVTTSERFLDAAPKGSLNAGDAFTSTSRLLNGVAQFGRPKGAVVGRDRGTATFVSSTRASVNGVATLPGGTVRFRGRIGRECPCPLSVVAGTGRFAGASGSLAVRNLGAGGRRALNVYTLTLP